MIYSASMPRRSEMKFRAKLFLPAFSHEKKRAPGGPERLFVAFCKWGLLFLYDSDIIDAEEKGQARPAPKSEYRR